MAGITQYVIIGLLGIIAITQYPKAVVAVVIIVILLWLIRLSADLYWHGKDKGKW